MRAWGRGVTWWARTAQKSGSRLLPDVAVPVWLSSACKEQAMAPGKIGQFEATLEPNTICAHWHRLSIEGGRPNDTIRDRSGDQWNRY